MRVRCVKRFFQKISLNLGIFRVSFLGAFMVLLTAGRIGLLFLFWFRLTAGVFCLNCLFGFPRGGAQRIGGEEDLRISLPSYPPRPPTTPLSDLGYKI